MSKNRKETWLAVIVVGIALIPLLIVGLWGYMSITATPLHPNPGEVPSVARLAVLPEWADAAGHGREIVRASLNRQNLPGLSVAVGLGRDLLWAEGFGWAHLEKKEPVAPETVFRIGTASIPLTSAAVGLLLEEGRLELDDPVPTFPEERRTITLRQLMGHTAGVANDGGDEGPLFSKHCERPADALQFLRGYERQLLFEPGTQYYYSSYGWIMVSAAIEAASKEPFLTFMRQRIFAPLGLRDTTPDTATEPTPPRATPYFPRFASDPRYGLHLTRPLDFSCYAGSSVFLSTPSDLVRFGMAINGGKLLQASTVQLLHTSQRLASGEETGYGLGWDLGTVALAGEQARWAGHDGTSLGGTVASLITFPEQGIVVAVISNSSYANTSVVAQEIAQAFAERGARPARN